MTEKETSRHLKGKATKKKIFAVAKKYILAKRANHRKSLRYLVSFGLRVRHNEREIFGFSNQGSTMTLLRY
ncbi:hypothetical protein DFP95_11556 [Cohnella lupini]|uniref:Uncharacterized protein n=1 Tax=Cohnella lupini TaxID=1294267 RepID=A0A3D9I2K5_9BACL|nr:hypothetical protein DFP95_11556 [Cohnella lupini]